MLSAILTYRLETHLGLIHDHHPEGVDIRLGYGDATNPQPYDPWNVSDLEVFKNQWNFLYPLVPITGYLPRRWLGQWGVALFRPPTLLPPEGTPTAPTSRSS